VNGNDLKTSAHAALEAARQDTLFRARCVFLKHAITHSTVTADDVQAAIDLPPGIDPKVLGPVPVPFARAGIIERVGFRNSTRADAHARPVSVWKLVDRAKAERWLSDNSLPAPIETQQHALVDHTRQMLLFDSARQSANAEGW